MNALDQTRAQMTLALFVGSDTTLDRTLSSALKISLSLRVLAADKARADRAAADLAELDMGMSMYSAPVATVDRNVVVAERDAARESRRRNPRGSRQIAYAQRNTTNGAR